MKRIFILIIFLVPSIVAAQNVLKIVTVNSPPYCSEELLNGGVYTEITTEAFREAGYEVQVSFMPWARALQGTQIGTFDILMQASFKEEREETLFYSNSVMKEEVVLLTKINSQILYNKIADLEEYTVGCLRNSITANILEENGISIHEVSSQLINLELLIKDRIDLIASQRIHLNYLIDSHYPESRSDLIFLEPPILTGYLYNVVTKMNPDHIEITEDFNEALDNMKKNGTYYKILEKHGF